MIFCASRIASRTKAPPQGDALDRILALKSLKLITLVSRPVNKCSIADAAFDLMGGFGPAEGFGIFVPVGQEAGDGLLQARDAVEAAATNGLRGDQAEPALDQVEPRGAGRGEVQMEARVRDQPL